MASIRPIDVSSVHRICSGQVVLDLAGAVKELVENALDAGATVVEVRLKEHGAELIEVADNGSGVSPAHYEALTAKYHTSKLSAFADLASLSTFGFRGEALSSLCSLCELSVITRTAAEESGVRLDYDHTGKLKSQVSAPRAVGTTVALKSIFSTLPELQRNLKREYGKLVSLLQAYALVCRARLVVTHATGRAPRVTVLHAQGAASVTREKIVTVLGAKAMSDLQPFEASLSEDCTVAGFVSSPSPGTGRAAADRQFFYLNGRPVDLPRVAKVLKEAFQSFNASQTPAAVLDFRLPPDAYDVNVTPDKRRIMLHAEERLMSALQQVLRATYDPSNATFAVGGAALDMRTRKRGRGVRGESRNSDSEGGGESERWEEEEQEPSPAAPAVERAPARPGHREPAGKAASKKPADVFAPAPAPEERTPAAVPVHRDGPRSILPPQLPSVPRCDELHMETSEPAAAQPEAAAAAVEQPFLDAGAAGGAAAASPVLRFDLAEVQALRRARASSRASAGSTARRFAAASLQTDVVGAAGASAVEEEATAELERTFQRSDFAALRVVGQFNLGFILAVLGNDLFIIDQHASDEIFNFERLQKTTILNRQPLISPQPLELSAAEEQTVLQHIATFKANGFEIGESGREGDPARLRLTAVPFSKGTTFDAADVHELVSLLDGHAPTGPLGTLESGVIRPTKVRAMLAMRACRCSIMIGRALDKQQMERVLTHLAGLAAPWNCPHGRPTMRHLATLF